MSKPGILCHFQGNSTDVQELPDSAIPLRRIEGEISTFGESYDQARGSLIRGVLDLLVAAVQKIMILLLLL